VVVSVSPGKAGTTTGGTTARDRHYTAEHILLATGGRPTMPEGVVGASRYAITSDGFFDMPSLPAKSAIVGGGYIAVELAGILNALGSDTSLVLRRGRALRDFDDMITDALDAEMKRRGIYACTRIRAGSIGSRRRRWSGPTSTGHPRASRR
jgi:glutathione reductase (NADPH)